LHRNGVSPPLRARRCGCSGPTRWRAGYRRRRLSALLCGGSRRGCRSRFRPAELGKVAGQGRGHRSRRFLGSETPNTRCRRACVPRSQARRWCTAKALRFGAFTSLRGLHELTPVDASRVLRRDRCRQGMANLARHDHQRPTARLHRVSSTPAPEPARRCAGLRGAAADAGVRPQAPHRHDQARHDPVRPGQGGVRHLRQLGEPEKSKAG
jgi:hypothetical protein